MPKRIQRKRSRGWRMPEGAVYVGRPSKWGNPYRLDSYSSIGYDADHEAFAIDDADKRQYAVDDFEAMVWQGTATYPSREEIQRELRGKDLACWCPVGSPCHADVLLGIANAEVGA